MSEPATVLLIAGSPSEPSRSVALLDAVAARLAGRGGVQIERLNIRMLPAPALLLADWNHLAIAATNRILNPVLQRPGEDKPETSLSCPGASACGLRWAV